MPTETWAYSGNKTIVSRPAQSDHRLTFRRFGCTAHPPSERRLRRRSEQLPYSTGGAPSATTMGGASITAGAVGGITAAGFEARRDGVFFAPGACAALRSRACRLRRAFFFTWALRRFILLETRLSCFPTAKHLALIRPQRQAARSRIEPVRTAHSHTRASARRPRALSARPVGCRRFAAAHLEAIAAVDRLDIEYLSPCQAENTLHRSRDIFVHPIGELDDHDGPFSRGSNESASNGARALTELAKQHVHCVQFSMARAPVYRG